jgi:hypothetical protein
VLLVPSPKIGVRTKPCSTSKRLFALAEPGVITDARLRPLTDRTVRRAFSAKLTIRITTESHRDFLVSSKIQ